MEIKNNNLKRVTNEDIPDSGIFVIPETVEVIGEEAFDRHMTLKEYLKENKVDQIEDDEEFCKKEHETVMEYCREKKFLVTDDDLFCIINRGLNDSYEFQRAEYIKDLWLEFGDVPMNPDTECIEQEWNEFPAGTHREEIWSWFEETYGISVAQDLIYL